MQIANANANLFNEHGLWQTLDALTSNKTQPGISFFVGLTLPLVACKDFTSQAGNRWRPAHSSGLLSVPLCRDTSLECFLGERV
jgi:hypothetical protein